jgi:hypothetical protein
MQEHVIKYAKNLFCSGIATIFEIFLSSYHIGMHIAFQEGVLYRTGGRPCPPVRVVPKESGIETGFFEKTRFSYLRTLDIMKLHGFSHHQG